MDSLAFLARTRFKPGPLYIVHGDESFLRRQVIRKLTRSVLNDDDGDFSRSVYDGETADFGAVMNELHTPAFFGPRRLVLVENADAFVSNNRARLEIEFERLADTATFVLEVKTWSASTRLAKMTPTEKTIACKAPAAYKLPDWCMKWMEAIHEKKIAKSAAKLLVDMVGTEMGQLAQELEKLATWAGTQSTVSEQDVDQLVGRSQVQMVWKIFDALALGNLGEAITILGDQFDQGEEPMRLLGAFAMKIRQLAMAGRRAAQGVPLVQALKEVGTPPFAVQGSAQHLSRLGRARAGRLFDKLLQLQMDLRGDSPLPPRLLFERFVVELGAQ